MSHLTKNERKLIYLEVLKWFYTVLNSYQKGYTPYLNANHGFCHAIHRALNVTNLFKKIDYTFNGTQSKELISKFYPEIAQIKPDRTYTNTYWWSPSKKGLRARIRHLEKIIANM